jgi:hypothetical protein
MTISYQANNFAQLQQTLKYLEEIQLKITGKMGFPIPSRFPVEQLGPNDVTLCQLCHHRTDKSLHQNCPKFIQSILPNFMVAPGDYPIHSNCIQSRR